MNLSTEVDNFAYKFDWYKRQIKLPDELFRWPDSAYITARDISDFDQLVKTPKKETVVQEPTPDDRFLVAAKVAGGLEVGRFGRIDWVEIEEPSETEQIIGMVGLKNMIFFFQGFEEARYILGVRGIPYEIVESDDHDKIRVMFDDEFNSFSFVNRPTENFITERVSLGKAKVLDSRLPPV